MYQKWAHMSRTLKDRPYWVKLNDSTMTDHDHINMGRTYYTSKPVLDQDGNNIYDEAEWGFTAKEIRDAYSSDVLSWWATRLQWYRFFGWNKEHPVLTNRQINKARALYAQGLGDTFIVCGTYQKLRTEKIVYRQMKDYCTAGEHYTSKSDLRHSSELPCTPSWDGLKMNFWALDMADVKTSTRREINGSIRRVERDTLKRVRDQWNSGWDVDDYDQDVDFTNSQPLKWANWLS